jgi:hypothetical protein
MTEKHKDGQTFADPAAYLRRDSQLTYRVCPDHGKVSHYGGQCGMCLLLAEEDRRENEAGRCPFCRQLECSH